MHMRIGRQLVVALLIGSMLPVVAGSQERGGAPPVPQIVTDASETVEIAPDRASISFAVETRARTAADAGRDNARIQSAVLDTLRRLGVPAAQLRTQGVSINPEYQYPRDGGRPTVVGYTARNTIAVEVRQLTQVGTLIDAGLAKGATSVGALSFFASSTADAEREALRKAVQRARADAQTIAEAAGGTLGGVLEIVSHRGADQVFARPAPRMALMADAVQETTPVESGTLRVTVSITARFAFIGR